jgi:hypothetical protein
MATLAPSDTTRCTSLPYIPGDYAKNSMIMRAKRGSVDTLSFTNVILLEFQIILRMTDSSNGSNSK